MTNFIKGISVIKHLGENVNKLSVIGITKKWIYCKPGFPAGKTEKQFQIKEIDDIIIKQYKHSRKHNYGNILFVLKSGKKIKLYGINDPHRFRSEIEKLMQPEESPASDAS